jgi:hypothetical protein
VNKNMKIESMKNKYIGMTNINFYGTKMTIIDYITDRNITVKFEDGYIRHNVKACNFLKGILKSIKTPSIFGIGYIDTTECDCISNSYVTWHSMMRRCYSEVLHKNTSTYEGVTCCKEWHSYKNFKEWYDNNYYEIEDETMCLDKDILVKGNKIYSPETCIFVPVIINSIFTKRHNHRGNFPIGVIFKNNSFVARCCNGNSVKKELGSFKTVEEAFLAYKIFKENYIKEVADKYKDKIPEKLYNTMYKYEVEITD